MYCCDHERAVKIIEDAVIRFMAPPPPPTRIKKSKQRKGKKENYAPSKLNLKSRKKKLKMKILTQAHIPCYVISKKC